MYKHFLLIFCLFPYCLLAQQKHTLSGYVYEKGSMESLFGAFVLRDYGFELEE